MLLHRFDPALCQRMQEIEHNGGEITGDLSNAVSRVQASAEVSARTMRRHALAADDWLDAVGKALGQ